MWSKIKYNINKRIKHIIVDKELLSDSDNPKQEYAPIFENINKTHQISFISQSTLNLFETFMILDLLFFSVVLKLVEALLNPPRYEFLDFFDGDEMELICFFSEVNRNKIIGKNIGKEKLCWVRNFINRLISDKLLLFPTIEVIAKISNLAYEKRREEKRREEKRREEKRLTLSRGGAAN